MTSRWRDTILGWTLALAWSGGAAALPISATDLWNGTTVTSNSPVHPGSNINDMFGAMLSPSEATNTVFPDNTAQGTVHFVEWKTAGDVTLRSFVLNAQHDGPAPPDANARDANFRGFSTFRLYAHDGVGFDEIFSYNPGNPYDTSVAPVNGIVENIGYGFLSLGVNIAPVTADRFRAEFVQFGPENGHASGPRIRELDGFDTFLTSATIPAEPNPVPEPHALALLAFGLAAFGAARRRKAA